jgi:hypothetical protein
MSDIQKKYVYMKILFIIKTPSKETLINYYHDIKISTGTTSIFYEMLSCGMFCHCEQYRKINERRREKW